MAFALSFHGLGGLRSIAGIRKPAMAHSQGSPLYRGPQAAGVPGAGGVGRAVEAGVGEGRRVAARPKADARSGHHPAERVLRGVPRDQAEVRYAQGAQWEERGSQAVGGGRTFEVELRRHSGSEEHKGN